MDKEITHGGARSKAGRKAIDPSLRKMQIPIYVEGYKIEAVGDIQAIQALCYAAIDKAVKAKSKK